MYCSAVHDSISSQKARHTYTAVSTPNAGHTENVTDYLLAHNYVFERKFFKDACNELGRKAQWKY